MAYQPTSQPNISVALGQSISRWPDGWYLYENGKLNGPLTAAEAFSLKPETKDGSQRLVSRKGFSQWYPLKDLAQIFQASEHMEQKLAAVSSSLGAMPSSTQLMDGPANRAAQPNIRPKNVGTLEQRPRPTPLTPPTPMLKQAISQSKPEVAEPAAKIPKNVARKAIEQEYFLARGRLRLGKLRSPWALALVGMPMTLGIYGVVWFHTMRREIDFHTQGSGASPIVSWLSALLSAVPILSIMPTYHLAVSIGQMEAQNRYRHVSPVKAALCGIFPPLAVAYLQAQMNRHWLLHAKHLVLKRHGEKPQSDQSVSVT